MSLKANARFLRSFSVPCHFKLAPTLMRVRLVSRCWSEGTRVGQPGGTRFKTFKRELEREVRAGRDVAREKSGGVEAVLPSSPLSRRSWKEKLGRSVGWVRKRGTRGKWRIGPGKVLFLCGGVRGRGEERWPGGVPVRGTSVLTSQTVQVARPVAPARIRRSDKVVGVTRYVFALAQGCVWYWTRSLASTLLVPTDQTERKRRDEQIRRVDFASARAAKRYIACPHRNSVLQLDPGVFEIGGLWIWDGGVCKGVGGGLPERRSGWRPVLVGLWAGDNILYQANQPLEISAPSAPPSARPSIATLR